MKIKQNSQFKPYATVRKVDVKKKANKLYAPKGHESFSQLVVCEVVDMFDDEKENDIYNRKNLPEPGALFLVNRGSLLNKTILGDNKEIFLISPTDIKCELTIDDDEMVCELDEFVMPKEIKSKTGKF